MCDTFTCRIALAIMRMARLFGIAGDQTPNPVDQNLKSLGL